MTLTHRQCTIEIKNQTSYTLSDPREHIISGHCDTPLPSTIRPSEGGSALFAKTPHTACGSVAVFTYSLQNKKKMAVMFSVPYDYNFYHNWYAVGIFGENTRCDEHLFDRMYYREQEGFIRGSANGPSLTYMEENAVIKATMTDTYQPILSVEISIKE
ncbi:DELTA-stichotoxin-Hmg2b-like [Parambassis ranga]|uniref:DELTA-stichotoxin-Hmg2b-like n=1 Tax=Parambassis ranga TaxID=210632 RepID=A0A6P7IJ47_9TELE|nr:DELTA-stichotoxin-Hmg2b-like [Parambassis ranga]